MKILPLAACALLCGCSIFSSPSFGQEKAETAPVVAPKLAAKTVFAEGFGEPQGVLVEWDGSVILTDFKNGEVVRLDKSGKKIAILATGLKGPSQLAYGLSTFSMSRGLSVGLFVTERKANRVVELRVDGRVLPLFELPEPIGLVSSPNKHMSAISHTTGKIYRQATGRHAVFNG